MSIPIRQVLDTSTLYELKLLNNLNAVVNPTASDDSDAGYSVGSQWYNQASTTMYTCFDASPGAAVWVVSTNNNVVLNNYSAVVPPTVTDDSGSGYAAGSRWYDTAAGELYHCVDPSPGAAVWVLASLTVDDLGTAAVLDTGVAPGQLPTYSQVEADFLKLNREITEIAGTTYTVTAADDGKILWTTGGSAVTITLPQVSTEDLPDSFTVRVIRGGAGSVSFATEGADVLVSAIGEDTLVEQYRSADVTKKADGVYLLDTVNLEGFIRAPSVVVVNSEADLPAPVGGKHILTADTYFITDNITISNTLAPSVDCAILGLSPLSSSITYTGTGDFVETVDTALSISQLAMIGTGASTFFNVTNPTDEFNQWVIKDCVMDGSGVATVGLISNPFTAYIGNTNWFGFVDGADLDGTINSIVTVNSTYSSLGTMIDLTTSTVTQSRVQGAEFFVDSGATGIARSSSIVLNAVWSNNLFTGTGTYLSGVDHTFPTVWFSGNRGIQNSAYLGGMYMDANATTTTIPASGTWVKVAGATTAGNLERFTMPTDNRLQYTGVENISVKVVVAMSAVRVGSGTPEYAIAVVKNGVPYERAMGVELAVDPRNASLVTNVSMSTNDYLELWIQNVDNADDARVVDLNFVIEG